MAGAASNRTTDASWDLSSVATRRPTFFSAPCWSASGCCSGAGSSPAWQRSPSGRGGRSLQESGLHRSSRLQSSLLSFSRSGVAHCGLSQDCHFASPELHGRLSGDDALSIEDDQRLLIWGFAADTLQDMASGKTPKVGGGRWLDYDGDAFAGSSLILGVGTRGSFPYAISTEGVTYDEPVAWHTTWLALLIEAGVLGLLAHGAILFVVAKHLAGVMRRWFIDPNSVALLSVMAALIVLRYLLMSLTEMNLYTALSPGVMFFGTLFGILASREPTQILRNPVG